MRKELISKAWGKIITFSVLFYLRSRLDFVRSIPSERLKSWFPQGGRLRQSENRHTINNIYFKFIIDLLRRKGKSPGIRNE